MSKVYGAGDIAVHAVDGVDLVVERGDYVAVMGASGSGKSTLMNIIGCLDLPTSGPLPARRRRRPRGSTSDAQALVRNRKIGFVFQCFNLIPRTSALRNVELPMVYAGVRPAERRAAGERPRWTRSGWATGCTTCRRSCPAASSSAWRSPARSSTDPVLLLADEPTGALDSHSTARRPGAVRRPERRRAARSS